MLLIAFIKHPNPKTFLYHQNQSHHLRKEKELKKEYFMDNPSFKQVRRIIFIIAFGCGIYIDK